MNVSDLQVGDKVLVSYEATIAVGTVARLTKTLIILENDSRWRLEDGHRPGKRDIWHPVRIEPFCLNVATAGTLVLYDRYVKGA